MQTISHLEIVNVQTGALRSVARIEGIIEAPNWTQDGTRLVYNSGGRLYMLYLSNGEVTPLDTGFAIRCNNDHVLSPDNTEIAISHHTAEDGMSRIYRMPMDGGVPTLITPLGPSYLHGWSPDGRFLSYCAERNGQYDIYTIPAEGGVETQLTNLPGLDDGPEYAPDGKYIWFNSTRTGLMQVWRMNPDGSEPTQMTFEERNHWFPHVSPDGRLVACIAYKKGDVDPADHPANKHVEIRLLNSDGSGLRTVLSLFGGQGTLNVNSWAPDSVHLAFIRYEVSESL